MRSSPAGFGRPQPRTKSYNNLLIIVATGIALLLMYTRSSAPPSTTAHKDLTTGSGESLLGRRELGTGTTSATTGTVAEEHGSAGTPAAPQVTSVARPPPHNVISSILDQRHSANVGIMLKGQSSHHEHLSDEIKLQQLGQSDMSETKAEGGGAATEGGVNMSDGVKNGAGSDVEALKVSSEVAARLARLRHDAKHGAEDTSTMLKDAVESNATNSDGDSDSDNEGDRDEATTTNGAAATNMANGTAAANTTTNETAVTTAATNGAATATTATHATAATATTATSLTAGAVKKIESATANTGGAGAPPVNTSVRSAETIASTNAFDALAYSKSMGHPGDTIHVLFTSNGSPYQNFQARIMVATFRIAQKMPGGEKMVAMTRILHRTEPDEIMDEVDTYRADPLQPECDKWCWFPVADRANAVQQFLDDAAKEHSLLKAPWLLLLETDYVWRRPLMALGSAYDTTVPGLSFAFGYINTRHPIVLQLLKERCPDCDPGTIPDSGPAPVLARYSDFRAATPLWEELSLWIETHAEAKAALGWVREMYAWDLGVAVNKLNIRNEGPGKTALIAQPPHDLTPGNATMYHYTWGSIFEDASKKEIWKFDKRFYTDAMMALKVPELPMLPPFAEGIKLHEGQKVTKELHETLTDMITLMNAGIKQLPDITHDVLSGKVKERWAEKT